MSRNLRLLIGLATVIASTLYTITDLLELTGGGFSANQLWLNYVAFLPIPVFMIGLYAIQRPYAGWMSLTGAIAYGISFIFFAGTTLYALISKTENYSILVKELGSIYTFHGGLMVVGGLLFGAGVIQARVLPQWTGWLLILGVGLNLLLYLLGLPDLTQILSSTIRNIALIGMGITILSKKEPTKP